MLPDFQRAYWENRLRSPDWYVQLEHELSAYIFPVVHDDPQLKTWRHQVYGLVGAMLERDKIPLAQAGPDLDCERQEIDTVVIHHTEEDPAISLTRLSAIGLLRQYSLHYLENAVLGRQVRGEPVWSGHFRQGKMVFFAYHWLIRPDGTAERLLEDSAIGWHAGAWDVNTRSIGLAFSGNYEHTAPPMAQIAAATRVIKENYPSGVQKHILGHCEVHCAATCPGEHFLSEWKEQLLRQL
ncbi:MAG TPA: peptidoglycan recognition family protein [Ktedonobacteraceae bacterium]|nr:peptidoglycan recognition family protein [Ktedonobacteraceae bacterium]